MIVHTRSILNIGSVLVAKYIVSMTIQEHDGKYYIEFWDVSGIVHMGTYHKVKDEALNQMKTIIKWLSKD